MDVRRSVIVSTLVLALAGLGLLGPRPAPVPVEGATPSIAEAVESAVSTVVVQRDLATGPESDCTLICRDEFYTCEWYEHDAWAPEDPSDARNEVGDCSHAPQNPCWVGHCENSLEDPYDPEVIHEPKHPACCPGSGGPDPDFLGNCDPENVAALTRNADSDDLQGVRSALALLGTEAVILVPERSAIQMQDCDGHIIMHLPVSPSLLSGLLAE